MTASCLGAATAGILLTVSVSSGIGAHVQAPRLVRSISGPSGKVVGDQYVFDEVRNRFVYPQDKSLTVYFEFESVPGDHVLTATWKQPDGRVASVSPDVRLQTPGKTLNCYWIFSISPTIASGVWTVDVRVDGQPAGSHAFEIAGVDPSGGRFSMDEVFKRYGPAIVRVYRLDATGRRVDSSSGFVLVQGAVATSFQSIDSAAGLELEFADGRRVSANEILAVSRLGDWAVVKAETAAIAPIPRGDGKVATIGGQVVAFVEDAGARVVTALYIGGVSPVPGYGHRIRFSPPVSAEALGGPLIDEAGRVIGIVGGSVTPGDAVRVAMRTTTGSSIQLNASSAGTDVAELPAVLSTAGKTLDQLTRENVLTPPLVPMREITYGGTTAVLPKDPGDRVIQDKREFSVRDDSTISVYTYWMKFAKLSKGELSGGIFDASNKLLLAIPPKKVSLGDREQRFSFSLSPKGLAPGYYRIDLRWDGKPAWRTYVRIVE